MARSKIKSSTDQRPFTMIYHDFLESKILGIYEKMVFIALKKFADSNNQCFPSLKKLAAVTGLSKRKIQDILKELEEKHIISIESRFKTDGGITSNLYTLHDFKELWNVGSSDEMMAVVEEYEDKKLISLLESKGYIVIKEKEPESEPTKAQNQALDVTSDTTIFLQKSQEVEKFTIENIKQLYNYDILIYDNPYLKEDIDSVMNILHTTMNTSKEVIRIGGEDKPTMVVIGKLMKLTYEGIIYAIEKFKEQKERIKNPISYMLTLLYSAEEQMHFDMANKVQYNESHKE